MRGCGKQYASKDAAERSKKGRTGRYMAITCRCGQFHLQELVLAPITSGTFLGAGKKPAAKTGSPESFSAAVCALIDARDGDDTGAALVRLCQRCGTTKDVQRHHRRGKDAGGSGGRPCTHCCCNGVSLCGAGGNGCHPWAHANPEQARAEGWIVSQSEDAPGSVGVMRFAAAEGGATQWPDCAGNWRQTAPEALEVA